MNESPQREVELFSEALQLPKSERRRHLEQACGNDVPLLERVEALLAAHERAGDFMEKTSVARPEEIRRESSMGEKAGDIIGRYKLLQQIGEGGCGIVFMAEQEEPMRRRVALKIIKPGMDTREVIARFEAERQALALMDHPSIAKVFDAGSTQSGRPYFVMELIRGIKITEYCDRHTLPHEARLRLFVAVCHAVQHAHQKGIIHRDLKPSNILVTETEEGLSLPVVIDFGIAKATHQQKLTDKTLFTAFEMMVGTPAYMSPEQAAMTRADVDTRTDIYSLGVLLYELLTGSTPFNTQDLVRAGWDEVRRVIREQEPPRPSTRLHAMGNQELTTVARHRRSEPPQLLRSVRGDLDWIAMKALEKDRTRRYETANGLALDIQRYLSNETVSARPPSNWYRFRKTVYRNKVLFSALGVVAIVLVTGLILVSASWTRERTARLKAQTEEARSRHATQFLKSMLEGVGPSVARGKDTAMLREILDRTAEKIGGEPELEVEMRSLIGRLYYEIGNYERAEAMHRAALLICRTNTAADTTETASVLHDLGLTLWKQRKLAEAEKAHREALAIRRRLLGNNHPQVADSLNQLGAVCRRQQKLAEAESLTRESLAMRRQHFGEEHVEVADSLRNLCIILGDQGKREEAESTARTMLAMRRKLLGDDHPLVASALTDLAWTLGFTGKPEEAEQLETEALATQRKLLGDAHPDVAKTVASLGDRMYHRGALAESHAVLRAALSIQRKVLGEEHPDALITLRNWSRSLEADGRWLEAEGAFRESIAIQSRLVGPEHPQLLPEWEGLVRCLTAEGKWAEAETALNQILAPAVMKNPAGLNLVTLRMNLMGSLGRWKEAASDAEILLQNQPREHYHYHTLAPLLVINGKQSEYVALCRRMLPLFADTANPYIGERIAKDCLLLPGSGVDLESVDALIGRALSLESGQDSMPYLQAAKALAEFRRGHFDGAVQWAKKPIQHPERYVRIQAHGILAMALWMRGQREEARSIFDHGLEMSQAFRPGRDAATIQRSWPAWLYGRILLDEAAHLLGLPPHSSVGRAADSKVP